MARKPGWLGEQIKEAERDFCRWSPAIWGRPHGRVQIGEIAGIKIIVSPTVPEDEIHIHSADQLVGKIINLKTD